MRVLVTGGAGFIGSHLVRACLDAGEEVRVLDDFSTGKRANLAGLHRDVELVEASLVDRHALERGARGCEIVYHQAAIASVPRSVADPVGTDLVNATGTLHALEAARRAGVRRFVFAGSTAVYGDGEALPKREDMPPSPRSPYALHVFGPRQDPRSMYAGVIPLFVEALQRGERPRIYGDGQQSCDFVYVGDVVAANRAAARAPADAAGKALNVGRGVRVSLLELLESIAPFALGVPRPEPLFEPARAGDVRHSEADVSRAKLLLGWEPSTSLEAGLRETVRWYVEAAA